MIVHFNDPVHGFTLPPTKFAAISYMDHRASTLATSPMLDSLPWNEAVAELEDLQNQFKAGGWEPYEGDDSTWFDLSPEGKTRLYTDMFEGGYARETTLRVRKRYAMTFRIKCTEGCWTRQPPYLFLIDVGVGDDTYARWDKDDNVNVSRQPAPPPDPNGSAGKKNTRRSPLSEPIAPSKTDGQSSNRTAGSHAKKTLARRKLFAK